MNQTSRKMVTIQKLGKKFSLKWLKQDGSQK
jgi:hypothetical protein